MSDPNYPPPPSYTPPPPPPGATPPGGVSPNRGIMIVLSYLWLLALVPLIVEKNDSEVQWHAKHGLVLTVAEIILWIAVGIVQVIASHVPFLGCITSILWLVVWLAVVILHILCIMKGVKGERFLIPGISEYANRF